MTSPAMRDSDKRRRAGRKSNDIKENDSSFVVVFVLFLKRYTRDEQPRMNWDKNDLKHSINYGFLGESENEREKSFNQINFGCSQ